ncbi:MAG: TetR family transcriptional regulator [Actinomycetota bacterium]
MRALDPTASHGTPPRRGRPPRFSRDGIVDVACELTADVGIDGLTMRGLANRLGTTPTTIYRHVPNHDELLAAVADSVIGETRLRDVSPDDPRAFLLAAAREYRRVMLNYPGVADYLLLRGPTGPHALRGMAMICDVLARTGLDARRVAWAYDWLMTTMSTYTSKEDRLNRSGGAPMIAAALKEIGAAHGDAALSEVLAQFTGDMEGAFERTTTLVIDIIVDGSAMGAAADDR